MPKRVKRQAGNVVRIPLPDGDHGYGFERPRGLVTVVDSKGKVDLSPEHIVQLTPLFTIFVMDRAIKSGRWPVIGHVELSERWLTPVKFFRQDRLKPERLSIAFSDGREIPSDLKGIEGLEKAAVWDPEHVEDRITDHFAGRPNCWLKALELRR